MNKNSKYKRCKKCKELVLDPDSCVNCANKNPLSVTTRPNYVLERRPIRTLDDQEGNVEEMF